MTLLSIAPLSFDLNLQALDGLLPPSMKDEGRMKNEESAEQGLQRLRQVFVFSQRVVEMGGEAEIAALRRTEAKEGELDAEFVVEPQLFGVDLAGPGPALARLGKGQGGHGAQHSFRTGRRDLQGLPNKPAGGPGPVMDGRAKG